MQAAAINRSGRGWWFTVLLLPVFPVYLLAVVLMLSGMYVMAEASRRQRVRSLRRTMRRTDRVTTWHELSAYLAEHPGTLIIDTPCLGWNDTDVWWTDEPVSELSLLAGHPLPLAPEHETSDDFRARIETPDFDLWCRSRYFESTNGRGKLLQATLWQSERRAIRRRVEALQVKYPNLTVVHACSAFAEIYEERARNHRNTNETEPDSGTPS